ncbi:MULTISPECIES: hypothetical protein [Leptolyngbya]|uniref:hypothetical protein n=1 Tax=Leptolyngbya TaxID=47251 RepID=UPI00168667ED|nr:hypothetical protein [Leptolyngbya sp. FACHB-1624]MBD1856720.1 hypothetical protein [Leptolyngbya sp. FACHB-1624]
MNNAQPPNHSNDLLQPLLEQALLSSVKQYELLQRLDLLGDILNSIPARRWLFERTQTSDLHQALKARQLIINIMQKSGKIWRSEAVPEVYDEAIARTWEWFSNKFQTYDPEKASFVTWFNQKLNYAIRDVAREQQNQPLPLLDSIPDPQPPPDALIFYEQILDLLKSDPGNTLRNCRMQNHQHVTCQQAILAILQSQSTSAEIPWQALANQFGVERNQLRDFCNHTAFPHFRRFCRHNGISHL